MASMQTTQQVTALVQSRSRDEEDLGSESELEGSGTAKPHAPDSTGFYTHETKKSKAAKAKARKALRDGGTEIANLAGAICQLPTPATGQQRHLPDQDYY